MNKKEALKIVKKNGSKLKNLPTHFKKDKEIVFAAVKQNGVAIQFADESLKKDKEIVLIAVKQPIFLVNRENLRIIAILVQTRNLPLV